MPGDSGRDRISLNGEWDFMPLPDRPQELSLPKSAVYGERKVRVPSSWRGSYESRPGYAFGKIEEYDYELFAPYGYPPEWDAAEAGLLRRNFAVPEAWAGRRIVLRLDGVMQQAAVYLDGERIAVWRDGYLPLRLDVTDRARPGGTHELQVVCANFDKTAIPSGAIKVTGLTGSWFGYLGRGLWQDVWLESYPRAALERIAVRTSVREGRLEIDALVGGSGGCRPSGDLSVALKVRRAGRPEEAPVLEARAEVKASSGAGAVREGGEGNDWPHAQAGNAAPAAGGPHTGSKAEEGSGDGFPFRPGEAAHSGRLCENDALPPIGAAEFRLDWTDAELWSPDSPVLYEAELELQERGTPIDRTLERFGFREFWSEGPNFMLNGVPLRLRGDSWHFQGPTQQTEEYVRSWYAVCREVGVNCIRLHAEPYPEYFLRVADETGMLLVSETAIYGSGKSMAADHPDYIRNCMEHVRRLVLRDRNHPSVILWSVENEMRWVDGRDEFKRHIPAMMDAMRSLDPTRLIVAEGDNRLLPKNLTEVESRHYNIDGTIGQWDRSVPLTFGEHGSWWYICPQNASVYMGLNAYRHTDEAVKGLAEKERLFVEYARRRGVSGISTFNFAHYFMRAMPERDIPLEWEELESPGVKPAYIPAYSLTLNNGLLPPEYPLYRPNPSFAIMKEAFRPAALIAAEYDRCFFDDGEIARSFDVHNDTLTGRDVEVEFTVTQNGDEIRRETLMFRQEPAETKTAEFRWMPRPASRPAGRAAEAGYAEDAAELTAVLYHDGEPVHEVRKTYRIFPAAMKTDPVTVDGESFYVGGADDYGLIRSLLPGCREVEPERLADLPRGALLIVGSRILDRSGVIERGAKSFAARGGRLLVLEQDSFSIGGLALSRRDFLRAHSGGRDHPVLAGLGDDDLMFWDPELREEGPVPIIDAAFEKPAAGDFRLLLECAAGDFGDGGDLWTPLLEYRGGEGYMLANQLGLTGRFARVPQACLLLRRLLAHAGRADAARAGARGALTAPPGGAEGSAAAPVRFLAARGGMAERFLAALSLPYEPLRRASDLSALAVRLSGESAPEAARSSAVRPGLLLLDPALLREPGAPEAARAFAEAGGAVLVLPCDESHGDALSRLLGRPVSVTAHEAYQLEADYARPLAAGLSPADLFGLDKVHLSPRDVDNLPLGLHRIDAEGVRRVCVSVEGTAWKDYFVHKHTAEHSRLALVELNRERARRPGAFVVEAPVGSGSIVCSQIPLRPGLDKSLRVYARLLANMGAAYADDLWSSAKGDAQYAAEAMMALPCEPYQNEEEMRAYYTDPEFSLNNLGEGLYGWMKKKERSPEDGKMRIQGSAGGLWFLSAFVLPPETEPREMGAAESDAEAGRPFRLRITGNAVSVEPWLNGRRLEGPHYPSELRPGVNRLIAVVRGAAEDIALGVFFEHPDGTPMDDLRYRMTIDEVEPK
ncbi:glycoside hydrolase family 2 [Saccharibacillus sp. VR-M41]|uniref:Glycoside hydrolase family 2 n=2 Tax=Saccharibacillus alkalitolerans TaxID=2705290 RepID=A0ABX0F6X0_9BACL|nr:glycoside hydrolase family 2 [Saccharibacillus alkalitolerans]